MYQKMPLVSSNLKCSQLSYNVMYPFQKKYNPIFFKIHLPDALASYETHCWGNHAYRVWKQEALEIRERPAGQTHFNNGPMQSLSALSPVE